MKIRHLAWMALVASLALTTCGQAEDVSLFFWEMPYAEAFPAGLALDDSGLVYVAADGGREVYRLDPTHGVFRGWASARGRRTSW